jgi:uncharacterized protein (TIGR03790 family)
MTLRAIACQTLLILFGLVSSALAQSGENVAVVINDRSAHSQRIGEHYARIRGVPASNVFRIQTSLEDAIQRGAYISTIEQPIAKAIRQGSLQDRIRLFGCD